MTKLLGIALGAGVTSAVLFAVARTASPAALLFACLAPLPVMIAGLGFAPAIGGAAALVAMGALGVALGPAAGATYLLAQGLPAWYLSRLAVMKRPAAADARGGPTPDWYPVPALMLTLAALAAVPVLVGGAVVVWHYGGYAKAVDTMAARLSVLLFQQALPDAVPVAAIVKLMPLVVTALASIILAANLWLAARSVQISGLLQRPWPNLPDALRMPRAAVAGLAALGAASLLPDPYGVAAGVPATALGVVFAFEGLAAAHVLTRGLSARIVILTAIYLATGLLMPWPLLALALLGCIDCLFPALRRGAGIRITKLPTRRQ